MINWPESLVTEVAHRRCIFFLGSGVSASSLCENGIKSPPTWGPFIRSAIELVPGHREELKRLVDEKHYLVALQAVVEHADPGDYQDLIHREFYAPKYQPSELHQVIHRLDSRIVITTNFDTIYERYSGSVGYKSLSYSSQGLIDEVRSDRRLIIKAHGSIDDLQTLVFTRKQYREVKSNYPQFYEVLKALLLTNTCVFIGCGMSDPDVTLILEELQISHSSVKCHYTLIKEGEHSRFVIDDWRSSYNVKALSYSDNGGNSDHSDLTDSLNDLFESVDDIRRVQRG